MEVEVSVDAKKKADFKSNYILFCLSRLVSDLGTSVFNFSLSLYILDITGSAGLFATILSIAMIPGILINAFCGFFVDRGNKKKIVITSDVLSGLLLIVFAILFTFNSKNIVLFGAIAVVLGTFQSVFSLTIMASMDNISTKEHLPKLNSAFQGIGALVRIVGPVIGALMYKQFGMQLVIIIDAFSFIASGAMEIFLRLSSNTAKEDTKKSYVDSVKEVYSYINGIAGLKILFAAIVLNSLVSGSLTQVVLPFITYKGLNLTGLQVSQIVSASFVGMIAGTVIISVMKKSDRLFKKVLLFFCLELVVGILWAFPLLPIFHNAPVWVITGGFCVLMAFLGMLVGFINIPALSYIQMSTPEGIKASIMGVVNTFGQMSMPVGMWLYGLMLEKIHWGYVVTVPSIILIVIIFFLGRTKSLRNFFSTTCMK